MFEQHPLSRVSLLWWLGRGAPFVQCVWTHYRGVEEVIRGRSEVQAEETRVKSGMALVENPNVPMEEYNDNARSVVVAQSVNTVHLKLEIRRVVFQNLKLTLVLYLR